MQWSDKPTLAGGIGIWIVASANDPMV